MESKSRFMALNFGVRALKVQLDRIQVQVVSASSPTR